MKIVSCLSKNFAGDFSFDLVPIPHRAEAKTRKYALILEQNVVIFFVDVSGFPHRPRFTL